MTMWNGLLTAIVDNLTTRKPAGVPAPDDTYVQPWGPMPTTVPDLQAELAAARGRIATLEDENSGLTARVQNLTDGTDLPVSIVNTLRAARDLAGQSRLIEWPERWKTVVEQIDAALAKCGGAV